VEAQAVMSGTRESARAEFRRILCPVDFSDASRHAIDHSIAIAAWYGAHVTALHVLQRPFVFEPPLLFAERGGLKNLPANREIVVSRLNDWMTPATTAGVPWDARIDEGVPADCVLQYARFLPADLVVIGTHGRSGFEHLVLGSVAEKVLRNAPCPVLTVPPRASTASTLPFKRILCPVDFSAPSIEALRVALSLAEEADAELAVLNVIDWPDDDTFLVETFDSPEMRRRLELQTSSRIDALIPDDARVWSRPGAKVAIGKAYQEIVGAANEMPADLIVIGVHGRKALDLTIFGSTTNQVVRRAPCPVLTIRSAADSNGGRSF
jgi:nucleotide-binding universal stress UspA family protein